MSTQANAHWFQQFSLFCITICLAGLGGCATFYVGEAPQRDRVSTPLLSPQLGSIELEIIENGKPVTLEIESGWVRRVERKSPNGQLQIISETPIMTRSPGALLITKTIENVLAKSGAAAVNEELGPLGLRVTISTEFSKPGSTFALLTGCLTLGILPSIVTYSIKIRIQLLRGGAKLREYNYDDRVRTWGHLLMIFAMPFTRLGSHNYLLILLEDAVWSFLHEAHGDGLLLAAK